MPFILSLADAPRDAGLCLKSALRPIQRGDDHWTKRARTASSELSSPPFSYSLDREAMLFVGVARDEAICAAYFSFLDH